MRTSKGYAVRSHPSDVTVWRCVCGREHASWWRTVQAPTCTVFKPWTKRYTTKGDKAPKKG